MKILILSQYYPPETGAPQNRLSSLAKYLVQLGDEVEVLTAMPNYPTMEVLEGYRNKIYCREILENIVVHRSWIYVRKSRGIIARLLNYFSFVATSLIIGLLKIKKIDLIICESPPLFLGISAVVLKRIKSCKLCMNISDLWPESAEKLGIVTNAAALRAATWLEEWLYRTADYISGQTQGICKDIENRFSNKRVFWLRNGFDYDQHLPAETFALRRAYKIPDNTFTVLYAGVIGFAQGLEVLVHAANILKDVQFVLVGDGPEKENLISLVAEMNLHNVLFVHNKPKSAIPGIVASCNAYVVPLKKLDLFLGAIPSKIFEPLALGCPVLLGVDGEAKEIFVDIGKCCLHYEPENYEQLAEKISCLERDRKLQTVLRENGMAFVKQKFDRKIIAREFHDYLSSKNHDASVIAAIH